MRKASDKREDISARINKNIFLNIFATVKNKLHSSSTRTLFPPDVVVAALKNHRSPLLHQFPTSFIHPYHNLHSGILLVPTVRRLGQQRFYEHNLPSHPPPPWLYNLSSWFRSVGSQFKGREVR